MMYRFILSLAALAGVGSGIILYTRNSRGATATPGYQVLRKEGRFEVRSYPELTLATTPLQPGKGMKGSFRRLFRFITGENNKGEKIAMTTPVLLSSDRAQGAMSFILPPSMDVGSVPLPASSEVAIQRAKGGEFAVCRYSGSWLQKRADRARKALMEWAEKNGLNASPETFVAFYDPPWTPPFMRRNEVLARLAH